MCSSPSIRAAEASPNYNQNIGFSKDQNMDLSTSSVGIFGPFSCGNQSGLWFELNLDAKKKAVMTALGRGDWYEFYPALEVHEREWGRALRKMDRVLFGKGAISGARPTFVTGFPYIAFAQDNGDVIQWALASLLPEADFRIAVDSLKDHFFALCEGELQFVNNAASLRTWLRTRRDHRTPEGARVDLFLASRVLNDEEFADALEATSLTYQPLIDYIIVERGRARRRE